MTTRSDFDEHENGDRPQANDWTLCFLVCQKDAAGGFVGGMLVTDNRARPLHFAFVQPVKPTTMQRILYGSTLDEHIKIDVIALKLWQGISKRPDILLVETPELIAARRISKVPTACIVKTPGTEGDRAVQSLLHIDVGPYKNDEARVGEILDSLKGYCDLHEPFNRIRDALKESQKGGS